MFSALLLTASSVLYLVVSKATSKKVKKERRSYRRSYEAWNRSRGYRYSSR
jgi:hypothetical protein